MQTTALNTSLCCQCVDLFLREKNSHKFYNKKLCKKIWGFLLLRGFEFLTILVLSQFEFLSFVTRWTRYYWACRQYWCKPYWKMPDTGRWPNPFKLFTYIEVGANTLKSSSTFQLPTKIMFSWKKNVVFEKMWDLFLGEQRTHIYNKICTNWNFQKQCACTNWNFQKQWLEQVLKQK